MFLNVTGMGAAQSTTGQPAIKAQKERREGDAWGTDGLAAFGVDVFFFFKIRFHVDTTASALAPLTADPPFTAYTLA